MSLAKLQFQTYKEKIYDNLIQHKSVTVIENSNYQADHIISDICQIFIENPKYIVEEFDCLLFRNFEDVVKNIKNLKTTFNNNIEVYFEEILEELENQHLIIWFKNFDALYYDKYNADDLRLFTKYFIDNSHIIPVFSIEDNSKSTQPFTITFDVFHQKTSVIRLLNIENGTITEWVKNELTSKNITFKASQIEFLKEVCLSSDLLIKTIVKDCIEKGKFSKNNIRKSLYKLLDLNKKIYNRRVKQYSLIQLNVLKCMLDDEVEQLMSKTAFEKYAFSGSASIIRALHSFESKGVIVRKGKNDINFTDPLFKYYLKQLIR